MPSRGINMGPLYFCKPSRFLREIDPVYLDISLDNIPGMSSPGVRQQSNTGGSQGARPQFLNRNKSAAPSRFKASPLQQPKSQSQEQNDGASIAVTVGCKVEHARFGEGIVEDIQGEGINAKATVNFSSGGRKTLLLKFAKLKVY
jgi:DNA helicase II / ATP-dependent DNA helicase PcrA